MRILIAGCGYVGGALAASLLRSGHEVWALSRRGKLPELEAGENRERLHGVVADLTDPSTLAAIPQGLDAFFFMPTPSERSDAGYEKIFVHGLGNLVDALKGVRGIMVSSTSVYGQGGGAVVTDESPAEPTRFSGVRLREAERLLLERCPGATILRSSGIYGPGRTRLLSTLVHHPLPPEVRETVTCRIHRDDLVRALTFAWQQSLEGTLIASDPHPATLTEMSVWARRTFEPESRRSQLPAASAPAKVGARANRRLQPTRLLQSNFRFDFPSFREGYAALFGLTSD